MKLINIMIIFFKQLSDKCQTNLILDLTNQSTNLPTSLYASKYLLILWCTVVPSGLLVSQKWNNVALSTTQFHR